MPTAREDLAAAVVRDTIYAIGGIGPATDGCTVEAYDPATDTWRARAPMPTCRHSLAAGVIDGIIYAVGGADSTGRSVATVEAYDPATNSWTTKKPMSAARAFFGAGTLYGTLYVAGGDNYPASVASAEEYDPATDTWTACASLHDALSGLVVAVAYLLVNSLLEPSSRWPTIAVMTVTLAGIPVYKIALDRTGGTRPSPP